MKVIDQTATDTEVQNIMNAYEQMTDAMGVYQHHDGVSGTAKQYVADDYNFKLFTAMQANNLVQTHIVDEHLEKVFGYHAGEWTWCARTNGTYLDCPVAGNEQKNLVVAAHNPSLETVPYLKVKVSHGNYKVSKLVEGSSKMQPLNAAVICFKRQVESGDIVNDCEMHIDASLSADSLSFISLFYDKSSDLTVASRSLESQQIVSSSFETVAFQGWDLTYGAIF